MTALAWPGHNQAHFDQLQQACTANCTCGDVLTPGRTCSAHQLLESLASLGHLAFVKELSVRTDCWRQGEFRPVTLRDAA